ncbi:SusD/RagB family nutrient-binding outer membrane lipoprotein [Chitinophaga sp. MM2321]|uniref:SusD/RagB family nutrient-binding outer membrane lipoprotein n=1 Tax=Chitinophaga sp. MM2321 TaxID=3137178 RepID=UPI0032D5AEA9
MNRSRSILAGIVLLYCAGCMKPADLQVNPNKATVAPPGAVLTGIEQAMFSAPWSYAQRSSQYHCLTYTYYGDQSYRFGSGTFYYYNLRDVTQLEKEATRVGGDEMRPYFALANFIKAYFYINMSAQMGDVPMSQAMMADKGIDRPAYDLQRDVYRQSFLLLKRAHDTLAALNRSGNYTVNGDVFYNGNLKQWQQLVNAFRLRALISLSNKTGDQELRIKETFAEIMQLPLPAGNVDNLQVTYGADDVSNYNPAYSANAEVDAKRNPLGAVYINLLTALRDPRLFVVALPATIADSSGLQVHDFNVYRGAHTGTTQAELNDSASEGYFSLPDYKYFFSSKTGPSTILLGYAEMNFTIAEAINRGWITGSAASYYTAGITASMQGYNIPADTINAYLTQTDIRYKGNNGAGLEQILQQKYLAFFQNSGWEPFYNQRRTGVPVFEIGPSNLNQGLLPVRWVYPASEYLDNGVHLKEAINRQYGGADDLNGVMWLLK